MIERHTLKNGVRIIAQKSKNSFAASVVVAVKTGSRNETPDIHGISHFLEHMCFKGTKKRPTVPDIAREIDSMGGRNNAFTSKEFTGYYVQADKKYFSQSLDILSDIAFNSVLSQEEIEKESGTIIEEINMYEDTPMYNVSDFFEQILFENAQMAQNVVGEKKTIQAINSDVMRSYRDKYYRAGNVIVSCAGNLPDDYVKQIEEFFSNISKGTSNYISPKKDNKLYKKKVYINKKETEQAHIYMGVEAYDIKNPSRYAQELLATILGGNMSSRLFIEVREKRGLAYYVRASVEANSDAGMFAVKAGLSISKTEDAVKIIKAELEKSKKDITVAELKRAKDYIAGTMALNQESSINVADENALEDIIGGKSLPLEERINLYEKVTLGEVKNVAEDLFRKEKMKLAVIGPFQNEKKFVKILEN